MNHAEQPDVIRARMLEVVRTLQRMPEGPDRDALDTYRNQLAARRPDDRAATSTNHQATSAGPRALAAPARAEHRTADARRLPVRAAR